MEFIMEHISWVFSGIGVSALGLLINYVIKKKQAKSRIDVKKSRKVKIKDNDNADISLSNCDDVTIEGNKYGER